MAAVPTADQAAGLLQNLSLDSQSKSKAKGNGDLSEPTKKIQPSSAQVDPKAVSGGYVPGGGRSSTPFMPDTVDPSMCYSQNPYNQLYIYPGFDGTVTDPNQYAAYAHQDAGVEIPQGVYPDNASLMYPHGYGYTPYGQYPTAGSAVQAMGQDSQLYEQHPYQQYMSPYFPASGTYTPTPAAAAQGELPSAATGQSQLTFDTANANGNSIANGGGKVTNGSAPVRPSYQNSSFTANSFGRGGVPNSGYQVPRYGYDGVRSPIPWVDGPVFSDGQQRPLTGHSLSSSVTHGTSTPASRNQSLRPSANNMGLYQPRPFSVLGATHGFTGRMDPSKFYGQYGNALRSGIGYGYSGYDARTGGRGWMNKNRGRGNTFFSYGNENMDGMNELNRGPRARPSKNQKAFAPNGNHDEEKNNLIVVLDTEKYNRPDFPVTHADAKFFVIKSYSEDDIHKSIKYNVWSSTPNGNKKLDSAYQEAQGKSGGCPIYLFFSVNTSGQFVGVAEMVGPVDFLKSVEYWQQDKWNGSFPVKWHIVKDVSNSLLKHITLENNENKPVTNSRDTQEVKLEQGLQMLKIFKEHVSKTSILEDFSFYEVRQKSIQEKKAKQQQFQKQIWEGKNSGEKNKDGSKGDLNIHKSLDISDLAKETLLPMQSNGDGKLSDIGVNGDVPKSPKPSVAETFVVNGVANAC